MMISYDLPCNRVDDIESFLNVFLTSIQYTYSNFTVDRTPGNMCIISFDIFNDSGTLVNTLESIIIDFSPIFTKFICLFFFILCLHLFISILPNYK